MSTVSPPGQPTPLPLLTDDERYQLLEQWNTTISSYPRDMTIQALFEAQVERTPNAPALCFNGSTLTYSELNARANQLALRLAAIGVRQETPVALCVERSLETIAALLGVLKAGAAYVPLDPAYPAERLQFMLHDTQTTIVLTQRRFVARLTAIDPRLELICLDELNGRSTDAPANPPICTTPDSLAYIMYTSGSTGQPKGIMISQRNVVRLVQNTTYADFGTAQIFLQLAPLAFDAATFEIWGALLNGAQLVIAPAHTPTLAELAQTIQRHGVTTLWLTAGLFQLMVEEQRDSLRQVRQLLAGGDVVSPRHARLALEAMDNGRVVNGYGPTENTTFTCCYPMTSVEQIGRTVPIGYPIANTSVYILDEQLQPVPVGVPGELFTGGDGLARGYLKRPSLTAERFIPDPWSAQPGARLYRTGDLARWLPDGRIEFIGRIDQQIKLRGFRIELGEIEAALLQHPDVRETVVIAREDQPGDKRLVAYVVGEQGTESGEQENKGAREQGDEETALSSFILGPEGAPSSLGQFLAARLPEYMIPSAFVLLPTLPLTANGKIDRKALPAPAAADVSDEQLYVAPQTATEQTLAQLYAEVLHSERVSIDDNFFMLGGHSLAATQVISRIRSTFHVELPLAGIFAAPTIRALAATLDELRAQALPSDMPPLQRVDRQQPLPLSFAQERVWFYLQLSPDNFAYNSQLTIRFTGRLDHTALERACNEVVRRHEIFRTTFSTAGDQPVQVIHPACSISIPLIDLEPLPVEQRTAEIERLSSEAFRQPFDTTRLPLVRWILLRLASDDHLLIQVEHHFIHDGWSLSVLIREIKTLYSSFYAGQRAELPDVTFQYADFAVWQRAWLAPGVTDGVLDQQLRYWKQQLDGCVTVLDLPTDYPRPKAPSMRGSAERVALPARLYADLKTLSQREGVTLFMTLLAAFKLLLYRYSGQTDMLVGSTVANRRHQSTENIIGMMVNNIVLRSRPRADLTFRELLQQVREVTLEAYAHQDVPFEKLVEAIRPERDMSRNPLYQAMFSFHDSPVPDLDLPNLHGEINVCYNGSAKFDLDVVVIPRAEQRLGLAPRDGVEQVDMIWEYSTDLFSACTIARMAEQFLLLLQGIVADPEQRLGRMPLLPPAEHEQLRAWNATSAACPADRLIHELIAEQAARQPDAPAIVDGARTLSYHDFNARANQLATYLNSLGVSGAAETRVAIYMQRSIDALIGLLAILKAGGVYLPLDPNYPPERIQFMLADSQASVVLTETALASRLANADGVTAQVVCLDSLWPTIDALPATEPAQPTQPLSLAYVIYTSGSTGQPKGVAIPQRALVNLSSAAQRHYQLTPDDRVLQFASLSFDVALEELFPTWISGAALVLRDERALHSFADFDTFARHHALTVANLPASYWHSWTAEMARGALSIPPELRLVIVGNERTAPEQLALWQQIVGERVRWKNAYGLTETTITTTIYDPQAAHASLMKGAVPIGRPLQNTQVYLLDQALQPVPIGVPAELYIGGVGVGRGYLNRPSLTAERFIPDPWSAEPGARVYRTGDLARYLPDGTLDLAGRSDDQIKLRGFRIELGEIEAALQQHPAVDTAAVVLHQDANGEQRLVAYVVGEPRAERTENSEQGSRAPSGRTNEQGIDGTELPASSFIPHPSAFREFLAERLPSYMVPSAFVTLDALPLMPNGKLDRRALSQHAFVAELGSQPQESVAPRTTTEARLAAIWADVLKLEQPSIHESFFALGGHSLLSTQIVARIRDSFGIELPLRSVFENATIADLAHRIDASQQAVREQQMPPLVPVALDAPLPLSFAQQRLWFLDQWESGSAVYHISTIFEIEGPLDRAALEHSLAVLTERHASLRTTFARRGDEPVQLIAATQPLPLATIDVSTYPPETRMATAEQHILAESQRGFDLSAGPLWRVTLVQLTPDQHWLVLIMHHIISDGWSMTILFRELSALYRSYRHAEHTALPALPNQYADYAVWQRAWLQGDVLDQQLRYWKQQLADAPAVLELPTDHPRPAVQTFRGDQLVLRVPPALHTALGQLSEQNGVTLFMTLLAGFQTLLHRYTGQDDIVVGVPIAGRTRSETEALIGCFVNTLVMRTSYAAAPTFRELLGRVREMALQAYAHQDVPFEKLVEELQPGRDLSHSPLFQVLFSLQSGSSSALDLADATVRLRRTGNDTARFDLSLLMEDTDAGLQAQFVYNRDLFEPATIERLAGHLLVLLADAVAAPDQRISELALLPAAEEHQLLIDWNTQPQITPVNAPLHQLFEQQAARTPDALALICDDQQLSYAALNRRANQLAQRLLRLGLQAEDRVGVLLERSVESVVALLAIMKAGGVYLPLDPAYPDERLQFMVADAGAQLVISAATVQTQLPVSVRHRIDVYDTEPADDTHDNPALAVADDQLAYLIYTSGSTGQPKGVGVSHRAAAQHLVTMQDLLRLQPQDRVLAFASFSFDVSLEQVLPGLFSGACVVVRGPELWDPSEFSTVIERLGLTVVNPPTSYWQQWAQAVTHASAAAPSTLRLVIAGGDALLPEAVKLWQHSPLGAIPLLNAYGPTEATITATVFAVPATPSTTTDQRRIPIGRPLPGVTAYILDRHGLPTPIGVPGELYLGGAQLARGYLKRPSLTAARFIPDPWSATPGQRLYKTGDLARYLPDGTLDFLGRVDQQIKLRGFRIELGEIEAVLLEHPDVREAVVVARADDSQTKRLVAYVVGERVPSGPTKNQEPNEQGNKETREQSSGEVDLPPSAFIPHPSALREFLAARLPEHMIPTVFMTLDALPMTPNGKLDRNALPAPEQIRADQEPELVAPRTPDESTLLEIWRELLGIPALSIDDNFFVLGGHSLLITQLASRIRAAFGIELSLRALFAAPTIAEQAALIADQLIEQASADDVQLLLASLKDLSPEEIRELLEADS